MNKEEFFNLIKLSIWGNCTAAVDRDIYEEMKQQAIASLPAACMPLLELPSELETEWKKNILLCLSLNTQINYIQSNLPISVPYVILKGTSAAKYYPHPEYRAMGDIDLMTRREDFDTACKQLVDAGYHIEKTIYKEIGLIKNGVHIDLHRQYASLNNPDHVRFLDDLIISNINSTHVLPDLINGLTLLDHINQHLEGGLGLRQIIDWMMFVDKCLSDEKWSEFYELINKVGLEKLAVVCTRMCEMYLGLPKRKWCADADKDLCEQLMDYVLSCGNFGEKKRTNKSISENAFAYASTVRAGFKLLQRQGLTNWKAAKKYRTLRPMAWVYQLFRYASRGLKRENALSKIKEEYVAARKRNIMFKALGVKTAAKGIVVLKDGKYVKE